MHNNYHACIVDIGSATGLLENTSLVHTVYFSSASALTMSGPVNSSRYVHNHYLQNLVPLLFIISFIVRAMCHPQMPFSQPGPSWAGALAENTPPHVD